MLYSPKLRTIVISQVKCVSYPVNFSTKASGSLRKSERSVTNLQGLIVLDPSKNIADVLLQSCSLAVSTAAHQSTMPTGPGTQISAPPVMFSMMGPTIAPMAPRMGPWRWAAVSSNWRLFYVNTIQLRVNS